MVRGLTVIGLIAFSVTVILSAQQKYTGPPPPKDNVPYLVHADNLVETEIKTASQQTKKDDTIYLIPGDKSTARTPLASPTLVILAAGMDVDKLQLFHLEVKNDHREVTFRKKGKGGTVPLKTNITKVSGNLYQIEVADSLPPGEYSLSPDGTNDVFCFAVY
jgi:hypothetical protein